MQPTLCSRCKKNVAVVFISKIDNGQTVNEGLCLKCAKDLGLPQVNDMVRPEGRARLRFETRMAGLLREEAVTDLRDAKAAHDRLEAVYNPYVDFDGVRALAAVETARLLSWL